VAQNFAALAAVEHFDALALAIRVSQVNDPGRQHDGALLVDIDARVIKLVRSTLQTIHDLETRGVRRRIRGESRRYRQHAQSGNEHAGPPGKRLAYDRHQGCPASRLAWLTAPIPIMCRCASTYSARSALTGRDADASVLRVDAAGGALACSEDEVGEM